MLFKLTPNAAVILYLAFSVLIILGTWLYNHYRSRHKTILTQEKTLRVCEYCHFAYLATCVKEVTQCPQCQSFNKNNNITISRD